jgi:hypothetical protein
VIHFIFLWQVHRPGGETVSSVLLSVTVSSIDPFSIYQSIIYQSISISQSVIDLSICISLRPCIYLPINHVSI